MAIANNTVLKVLVVLILSILFYRCDNHQYESRNQELLDSSYVKFAKRTNDMFGVGCYGFQIYFNRDINIKDTIQGIIEIYDSNELKINHTFSDGDFEYDVINGESNKDKITLVPKSDGVIGYYTYRFIFEE
jgi:hypothetical protein